MYRIKTFILPLFALLFSAPLMADVHPEQRLLSAVDAIQDTRIADAETILKGLIQERPKFKLANMLYADLLKSKIQPLDVPGAGLGNSEERQNLLSEIKLRLQAKHKDQYENLVPAALTRLDDSYLHAFVVDLDQSRLFVFENYAEQPKLVADYFVSMGRGGPEKEKRGDLRTPLGVYFIQSYIPPDRLADKYGAGAYPINYPNAWDEMQGRTGDGIWLHGTRSGTYNRPPLASEGCVVLPNDDLREVGAYITLGQTPVLIGNGIQWLPADEWKQKKVEVSAIFEEWVNDWESRNTDNYLSHYSKDFLTDKKDYAYWATHKRRIAKYKKTIKVEASDVSILKHPNEDLMVTTFHQNYKSDNFVSQAWKRQYWRKEADGNWRIIYEGEIPAPTVSHLAKNSL
ncbi:MAG: L,D-transpeptidase [Gammaproteobacteria bacterium]|nr:L,D-transpeptidase [Gammaproteobacteria bacterium]